MENESIKAADLLRTEIFTLNNKINNLIEDFIDKNGGVNDITMEVYRTMDGRGYRVNVEIKL